VKQSVSHIPYTPSGGNRNKRRRRSTTTTTTRHGVISKNDILPALYIQYYLPILLKAITIYKDMLFYFPPTYKQMNASSSITSTYTYFCTASACAHYVVSSVIHITSQDAKTTINLYVIIAKAKIKNPCNAHSCAFLLIIIIIIIIIIIYSHYLKRGVSFTCISLHIHQTSK
jgi:hypothetical protein